MVRAQAKREGVSESDIRERLGGGGSEEESGHSETEGEGSGRPRNHPVHPALVRIRVDPESSEEDFAMYLEFLEEHHHAQRAERSPFDEWEIFAITGRYIEGGELRSDTHDLDVEITDIALLVEASGTDGRSGPSSGETHRTKVTLGADVSGEEQGELASYLDEFGEVRLEGGRGGTEAMSVFSCIYVPRTAIEVFAEARGIEISDILHENR